MTADTSSDTVSSEQNDARNIVKSAVLPSFPYRIYVLILCILVGAISNIDRQILFMLAGPIKAEFKLSDSQVGMLTGLAFAASYVLATIPLARLADSWSRKGVLSICVGFWSAMTAFSGAAQSFTMILLARIGVGAGEAGGNAPAQALLADFFPKRQRATVMSIFLLGAPIGMGIGLSFGGWALENFGWREAFYLAAIPGLILAPILLFTVKHVSAGQADGISVKQKAEPLWPTLKRLWKIKTLPLMLGAIGIQTLLASGVMAWMPQFFSRTHGMQPAEVGAALGIFISSGSILGHLAGGPLAHYLGKYNIAWHLRIPVFGSLLGGIASVYALLGPAWLAFPLIGLQVFLNGLFAPMMLFISTTLPPVWARATCAACSLVAVNLIGFGVGPYLIGELSDHLMPIYGVDSLKYALLYTMILVFPAMLFFYAASRRYAHDYAAADADIAAAGGSNHH